MPLFNIYFKDTKQTYTQLYLDYVLKYSLDILLKYHELKAEYIVRKAREASATAKVVRQESEPGTETNTTDGEIDKMNFNEADNAQMNISSKQKLVWFSPCAPWP